MKNIPRLFIPHPIESNQIIDLSPDHYHYLARVMRTDHFLAFHDGLEYAATLENQTARILAPTEHKDPSGSWTFNFPPIKKIDELVSSITQMGVAVLQPVITDHTSIRNINYDRLRRIIIESSEQSGRNSVPDLRPAIFFNDLVLTDLIYGNERMTTDGTSYAGRGKNLFIGPEGGFSDTEFATLDTAGAIGVSLGRTILRSEVAAIALCARHAAPNS